ncbi:MAG: N-6 DNA methylase [Nanoarchaeota archaeon]|nr:N-6 DNA methylase [Nanoarchaeota archaeon]
MAQQRTKELIKNALENSFNLNSFKLFINNLLNKADLSKSQIISPEEISSEFKDHIKSCQLIGEYTDKEDKKIHILTVQLNNERSIERARTLQRNFIAKYLKNNPGINSSLVAFFQEGSPDWRFSFVKLDLSLNEKGNLKYDFTPARRYSFLVGKDEFSHTAQSQLAPIIENEGEIYISDIEECFHVEKVTKEFFEKYRGLFDRLLKSIDSLIKKDIKIKKEFEDKNIEKEDFAKRILGQIVFLYFLQKKGWLGIEKDQLSKKFKRFGEGDKNFLYNLFKKCKEKNKNFFNDYLEHLFYSALAQDRRADDDQFHLQGIDYKLPFLNGGLFEPIGTNKGYNWRETDILISNEIFSNSNGEGILDTFNLYNFTVKEDEPMEKEVAIDPEMLGKVFENLLETKERKSTGSFYTPREIVHYMCQQSLINYLETNTQLKKEIIENFVSENNSQDISKEIVENKFRIDNLLKEIKVVDPAVGSGAFLVGMMSEIVKARSLLNSGKKIFDLKEECIENNLHGVDISPGAVDICQLRLWLSLIVDEEDYGNVKPLPNLDYKIMCGNSLIEEFEGMKLWDDKWMGIKIIKPNRLEKIKEIDIEINKLKSKIPFLINQKEKRKELEKEIKKLEKEKIELGKSRGENLPLFESDSARKLIILKKYHEEFTHISDRIKKQEQKKKIEDATIELIKSKLIEENKKDSLKEVEEILQKKRSMPFFLWKMNFIDVFDRDNPGFDVVIANPPYVSSWNMGKENKEYYLKKFKSSTGHYDLYILFIEKSFKLLREMGVSTFITSNKYLTQKYGLGIRRMLLENKLILIINFNFNVFETATVDTAVTICQKSVVSSDNNISILDVNSLFGFRDMKFSIVKKTLLNESNFRMNSNVGKIKLYNKIRENTIPLENICYIDAGIVVHSEKTMQKKEDFIFNKNINGQYKRYCEGKNITKNKLSNINKYLNYAPEVHHRGKFKELFENKKILIKDIAGASEIVSVLDYNNLYIDQTIRICVLLKDLEKVSNSQLNTYRSDKLTSTKNKFLLPYLQAILSSSLLSFYFSEFLSDRLHISPHQIRTLPIKNIPIEQQKQLAEIVDKIMSITNDENYVKSADKKAVVKDYEKRIDQIVYDIYDLTSEEIKIVEESKEK